jgi:acetyl esterase/lipase
LTAIVLVVVAGRILRAIPAVRHGLDDGLGSGWRDVVGGELAARLRPRFRFAALLGPFFRRRWDVERIADISYGDAGTRNLLDVYRHRSHPANAPVLIHFHGGAMVKGRKNREALPLLYRLAGHGWLCVSANYRLRPAAEFPAQLIDAKKVIAWVRTHGKEFSADPSAVFVAGSSAGAQLAAQAALTPNEPGLQPGFEGADTSVAAAIALYGYYGWFRPGFLEKIVAPSPVDDQRAQNRQDEPPFFVVHGDQDTVLPVEGARRFAQSLRRISRNPVVYVELPGAQHSFDLFHSIRNEAVIDGIESFAAWVRAT